MYECKEEPTYQDYLANNKEPVGCGNFALSVSFFLVFVLSVSLVFLNLFVAVILEAFASTISRDAKWVDYDMIEDFRDVWSKFDPSATGFIKVKRLKQFLLKLGSPLGWEQSYETDPDYMVKVLLELNLPTYNDGKMYSFVSVLNELYM